MVRVGEISTAVRRSVQRGAALASGVGQQAVEEAAGIGVAGVIAARVAPTGKIPFDGTSFGDQDCNGCGPLGRPVCVKRRLEVQPRLRLRHRMSETTFRRCTVRYLRDDRHFETVPSWNGPRLATGRGKLAKWRTQTGLVDHFVRFIDHPDFSPGMGFTLLV